MDDKVNAAIESLKPVRTSVSLHDWAILIMILGAKTDYRCPPALRREIEAYWAHI